MVEVKGLEESYPFCFLSGYSLFLHIETEGGREGRRVYLLPLQDVVVSTVLFRGLKSRPDVELFYGKIKITSSFVRNCGV